MEHIDLRRARELVIDVAEGREDFRYERRRLVLPEGEFDDSHQVVQVCDYVRDDRPSCIVGHVLFRAGVTVEQLKAIDTDEQGSGVGAELLASKNPMSRGVTFDVTAEAAKFLGKVQNAQDFGDTWGECADMARNWGVEV